MIISRACSVRRLLHHPMAIPIIRKLYQPVQPAVTLQGARLPEFLLRKSIVLFLAALRTKPDLKLAILYGILEV